MPRNTHHRTRDHFGMDLADNVTYDPSASLMSAVNVQDAIDELDATISSSAAGGIQFVIGGGTDAISTGIKGDIELPFAGQITAARMFADQTGSIVVDIWKDTYANYPPTDADSITASAPPTISSSNKSQDTTLTGWTKTFSAGDVLRFNVDSATTVTRVTLALRIRRT